MASGTRLTAALTVLAFLLGNLGSLIHEATTTHTRCPEHGELVHGETPAADDHGGLALDVAEPAGDGTARPSGDAARIRALPQAGSHEHEHCYVTCPTRGRIDPAARAPSEHAPLAERAPLALAADLGSAGRPLYRTAPKTSPPA
jgi:hypothetical protein